MYAVGVRAFKKPEKENAMNCERCGKGSVSWTSDSVVLYGGVNASLCNACITEWNVTVKNLPLWQGIIACDARAEHYRHLASAGAPVPEQEIYHLFKQKREQEKEVGKLAQEFIKPLVPAET